MLTQVAPASMTPESTTAAHLGLALVLSVVLKFIVDALRAVTNPRDSLRAVLPWITAFVGAAAGVLDYYVGGAKWTDAVLLGGFGVGSTGVNEMSKLIRKALSKPAPASPSAGCTDGVCEPPHGDPPGGASASTILLLVLASLSLSACAAAYQTLGATADGLQLSVGKFEIYNAARRREILAEAKPSCAEKATEPEVEACFATAIAPFEASRRPASACIDGVAPLVRTAEVAVEAKDAKAAASLLPEVTAGAVKCGMVIEAHVKATKKAEVK